MMHTELYCDRLADIDPVKAIRAIHEAYLQLSATKQIVAAESYDNQRSMNSLATVLKTAGHPGF